MEIIKIAWRNLWRNKVRSLIVIMAVCFGMIGGGFSTALMIGAVNKRIEAAIGNETAHVQVNKKGYVDNPDINLLIDNSKEQSEKYLSIDEVQGLSCRLIVNAMMSSTRNATGVNLVGVNPENEKQISSLYTKIENGDFFEEEKRNQIIISKKLAEELNADIRTKLVLSFQDIDGVLTGASFRVSGIYHTGNNMFDQANVFVRRSDLERLTGISNNSAHEIAILFTDNDDLKERTAKISSVSPESVTVRNWEEIMPDLSMMSAMTEQFLSYLVAIILFALAFGIINTMLMAVLERRKEIGMLMALGMNRKKIRRMITWETLFLTAIGSVAGLCINQLLVWYFGTYGLDLSSYSEGFASFGFEAVMYPEISGMFYIQIVGLVIITALVSAIFPIRRAVRMNPADVLRTE